MAQVNPSFSDTDHNPTQTEAGIEVFEVVGSIKWFNASKGYGFITPDNGLADIMLHVTCLRAGGYQTAYEGARVHCEVLRRPKSLAYLQSLKWAAQVKEKVR